MPVEPGRGTSGLELAGLGAFLAVAFLLPLIAGLLVDQVAHTTPIGLLVGLLAGIAAAGWGLWARFARYL
jgi:Na+/proline symporter